MKIYVLGLMTGGLMEDPERKVVTIRELRAADLKQAKRAYARMTQLDVQPEWNPRTLRYFGWPIVQVVCSK